MATHTIMFQPVNNIELTENVEKKMELVSDREKSSLYTIVKFVEVNAQYVGGD